MFETTWENESFQPQRKLSPNHHLLGQGILLPEISKDNFGEALHKSLDPNSSPIQPKEVDHQICFTKKLTMKHCLSKLV